MFIKELNTFKKQRDSLLQIYKKGFVVIKGVKVLGVWNDEMDALGEGHKAWGNVKFLVHNIDPPKSTPLFTATIISI